MATIQIADKPTLDEVNTKIGNVNTKMDTSIGTTTDTGGNATAGTVMGKLNALMDYLCPINVDDTVFSVASISGSSSADVRCAAKFIAPMEGIYEISATFNDVATTSFHKITDFVHVYNDYDTIRSEDTIFTVSQDSLYDSCTVNGALSYNKKVTEDGTTSLDSVSIEEIVFFPSLFTVSTRGTDVASGTFYCKKGEHVVIASYAHGRSSGRENDITNLKVVYKGTGQ